MTDDAVIAQLTRHAQQLDDLEQAVADLRTASAAAGTWCASWWDHHVALVRLEAVWRAWEALRLEAATGIARWLRDVADPDGRLRDRGPLRTCGDGKHLTAPALPI